MVVLIADDRQSVLIEHVSWSTFEALAGDLADAGGRLTYDEGRLEIMSPSPLHEGLKKLLSRLIEIYTLERGIDIAGRASTTFKRPDLDKGAEPDECYFVKHAAAIRGKKTFDLATDPPPDLVVEVEVTKRAIARLPIYAAMGVPEVWRHDGKLLRIERLAADGTYRAADRSGVFPDLPLDELRRALERYDLESETAIVRSFQLCIRHGAA